VNRDKLFVSVSTVVLLLFVLSAVMVLVWPIERSFAGTFPEIVGASVFFSVLSIPLLVWGIEASKKDPARDTRFHKHLLAGLALPPTLLVAGFLQAFVLLFGGR
jgi:hypothetical protein